MCLDPKNPSTRLGAHDPGLAEAIRTGDASEEVAIIARLAESEPLPEGVRVVTRFGDIATLRLARGRLSEVAECEAVLALEASRRLRAIDDDLDPDEPPMADGADRSEFELADRVETRRPPGVRGRGENVVVAALDWGLDFAHPAFRKPDGSTRILALWDQRAREGPSAPNRWGYGRIFDSEAINRALQQEDPYEALGYHPGDSDKRSGSGSWQGAHGTHVLDIAAGNGRGGGTVGVAPGAELVFVHLSRTTRVLGPGNLGDSATVLEGYDFVLSQAGDRPTAVNISVGAQAGPHDGTTLVEQGIDRAVWLQPGRVVVNSAGNYRTRRAHAEGRLRTGAEHDLRFEVPVDDPTDSNIELYYEASDRFRIVVVGPGGGKLASVGPGQDAALRHDGETVGHVYHHPRHATSGDRLVDLFLEPGAPGGVWALRVRAEKSIDGRYHAWIERDKGPRPKFLDEDVSQRLTTGTICNGLYSVTVGAFDPHSASRPLASFSSSGPTRDGRAKPEIIAPGRNIRAARSTPPGEEPGARFVRKSGTSMAAPHVTGCVALMHGASAERLDIIETRALLFSSAERPTGRGTQGSELHRMGHGFLDIAAAERAARALGKWAGVRDEDDKEPNGDDAAYLDPGVSVVIPLGQRSDGSEPEGEEDGGKEMAAHGTAGSGTVTKCELHQFQLVKLLDSAQLPALVEPGGFLSETLQSGDVLRSSGAGARSEVACVLASGRLESPALLRARGVDVETAGPGGYAEVIEPSVPGGAVRVVGRRVTDRWGRIAPGRVLLRGRSAEAPLNAADSLPADDGELAETWDTADSVENLLLWPVAPQRPRFGQLAALRGGLVTDTSLRPRVSAIVGPGATLRGIARRLLPVFTAAATAEHPAPTLDELARGILVYSQFYLPVLGMGRHRDGLRIPLPIELERPSGDWIVNPESIRLWSRAFEPAWAPLLDRRPQRLPTPDADALETEATEFLRAHPTEPAQGIRLNARTVTNPFEAVLFVFEAIRQLGANAFGVALEFLDNTVNHQAWMLASTISGNAILRRLDQVLAAPRPGLDAEQTASLHRGRRLLAGALRSGGTWVTPRELPETPQQLANRPGRIGWQVIRPDDPPGGRHRMVHGRDVLAGKVGRYENYRGPAYGGRMAIAPFVAAHRAQINPTGDPKLDERLRIVEAITMNEGLLDAVRMQDRAILSLGVHQWSAHEDNELPWLLASFQADAPDEFMLFFEMHGLDVRPAGVDGHNNPRFVLQRIEPNGTRVDLNTRAQNKDRSWLQKRDFFGGRVAGGVTSFHTDWAARCRLPPVASNRWNVTQMRTAAARFDRIVRDVGCIAVGGVPVPLKYLITSDQGVALILDSHINFPGSVRNQLQAAANAAGPQPNDNAQDQAITAAYAPIRTTANTPRRNANINTLGLDRNHGSFTGW